MKKRGFKLTPFDPIKADREFRAYCKKEGVDLKKLLHEAGKNFTDEAILRRKNMTDAEKKAEIDAWVEYEMSVDDWGRPLTNPPQEFLTKMVYDEKPTKKKRKSKK